MCIGLNFFYIKICVQKRYFFILRKDYLRLFKLTTKVVKALTKVQENLLEQVHLFIYSSVFPILFPHLALT